MAQRRRLASRSVSACQRGSGDREPSLAKAFDSVLRGARGLHADPDPLQARAGALRPRVADRNDPPWAETIGRARFVEAFAPVDPYEEQDLVVSSFEYPDGRRHALAYLVDQNFDGLVRQAHLSADPEDVRQAFLESGELALRPVDAQEVADRLAQGLLVFDASVDPPCDDEMAPLVPLLRARQRTLPPPTERQPPEFDAEAPRAMVDEFARSQEAGRSKVAIELADLFVSCRLERLDADPLRWSPIAVELLLCDWLPRKAALEKDEVRAVPGALKRWVRFAGRKKGLAADLVDETLAAVDQFTPDFRRAMQDPSRHGPAGSVVNAMRTEGVDPTDERAVRQWIEAFNARPPSERDSIVGWSRSSGARPGETGRSRRAGPTAADAAGRRSWAVPPARGKVHGIDLSLLDPADPDDRSTLIEAEHPQFARALRRHQDLEVDGEPVNPRLHLALHEIVASQLWDGQPPETWAAARRLVSQGFGRHDVLHMLMAAVSDVVDAALKEPLEDRRDEMRLALDALGRDEPNGRRHRLD
jgi:hypothetical protein